MIKRIINAVVLASFFMATTIANAQENSGTASQSVTLNLAPVIQISAMTSPNVNLGFNNISNYVHGVESANQQFKIHSNKDYLVTVRANAAHFSYSGNAYPAPQMPVSNTLFLSVAENNTGGTIANSFSNFVSLSDNSKQLLLNCKNGGDKTFSINYKAIPGPQYPAGDYTVGILYTATQP